MSSVSKFMYRDQAVRTYTVEGRVWLHLHDVAKCIRLDPRTLLKQVPPQRALRHGDSDAGYVQPWIDLVWMTQESAFRKQGGIDFVTWLRGIAPMLGGTDSDAMKHGAVVLDAVDDHGIVVDSVLCFPDAPLAVPAAKPAPVATSPKPAPLTVSTPSTATPFSFDGHPVRVEVVDGEPWFVAKDIAEALEYEWTGHTVQHVPAKWKGMVSVTTPGGRQNVIALSEAGMNFFVLRSDKPVAIPFQEWIAGEVLPSIRRTGSYTREVSSAPQVPTSFAEALRLAADAHERAEAAAAENARLAAESIALQAEADKATEALAVAKPHVDFSEWYASQDGTIQTVIVAKELGVSDKVLREFMDDIGWTMWCGPDNRRYRLPRQPAIDAEYLVTVKNHYTDGQGRLHEKPQVMFTPKGAREAVLRYHRCYR